MEKRLLRRRPLRLRLNQCCPSAFKIMVHSTLGPRRRRVRTCEDWHRWSRFVNLGVMWRVKLRNRLKDLSQKVWIKFMKTMILVKGMYCAVLWNMDNGRRKYSSHMQIRREMSSYVGTLQLWWQPSGTIWRRIDGPDVAAIARSSLNHPAVAS